MTVLRLMASDDYDTLEKNALRRFDSDEAVWLLLAKGAKPVAIEGIDKQIFFVFRKEDVDVWISKFLGNEEILVPIHEVFKAFRIWKNALIMMKSKRADM